MHRATCVRGARRAEDHEATDAIIRMSATCVCGSDLWPYRGIEPVTQPTPFGHEYCGIVEEVGSAVESIKPGQFVIGSFFASDNTCSICPRRIPDVLRASRARRWCASGAAARPARGRHPGRHPRAPPDDLIPSLLTLSDVMGTGWFAADAANVKPGVTAVVVATARWVFSRSSPRSRWAPGGSSR